MAQNDTALWWVCYDIAHPRHRARVLRRLKQAGVPLQFSLFEVPASAVQIEHLMDELMRLCSPNDDLRAYRCSGPQAVTRLGRPLLAEGVLLADPMAHDRHRAVAAPPAVGTGRGPGAEAATLQAPIRPLHPEPL